MSLPSSKAPAAQSSIRSFFTAKTPKYAPPPTSRDASTGAVTSTGGDATAIHAAQPEMQSQMRAEHPISAPASPIAIPPLPASLPREAAIRPVTLADTTALRRINALLLPVSYPDAFYARAIDPAESGPFSRVITWAHDGEEPKVVGGVVCRVEPALLSVGSTGRGQDDGRVPQNLYIQSLCLLSPYRGLGLINAALDNIIGTAMANPALGVGTVTAHVWTQNEEGLHWYEARGFKRQEPAIEGTTSSCAPALHISSTATSAHRTTAAVVNLPPQQTTKPPPPQSGPPPSNGGSSTSTPPPGLSRGQSYQNQRAETEWNDLPADMAPGMLAPPRKNGSEPGSSASSRSSSTVRKKRDRSYPAAAFGS
ncbi:hypothetical protein ACCO45_010287 [Purpureocillium lilacinum]|uniref:Uncharacterized protein n=1 Tax=Purpureocillium lilacinum TaxID=33203 RepID=A0ACC4DEH5_PURLI